MTKRETTQHRCSICKKFYEGFGNNARPINNGRCCTACNDTVVIPKRFADLRGFYNYTPEKAG